MHSELIHHYVFSLAFSLGIKRHKHIPKDFPLQKRTVGFWAKKVTTRPIPVCIGIFWPMCPIYQLTLTVDFIEHSQDTHLTHVGTKRTLACLLWEIHFPITKSKVLEYSTWYGAHLQFIRVIGINRKCQPWLKGFSITIFRKGTTSPADSK